jgi:FkbM family methyltransferase
MTEAATDILMKKLAAIERLARGSVLGRFLKNPVRYVSAVGYWRLVYPLRKRGRFARAHTFFGAEMEVVLPSATEIFLFGAKTHDSEIRLARFLMRNLRPGDTFCDVGAHFGYFTLLASQLVGENGRVIAFEASRSTYGILKKNTAQAANVTALHRAASDENKTLVFNEFPALFSEYNSLVLPEIKNAAWLKNNPPQRIEVQGQRLDDFFNSPSEGVTFPMGLLQSNHPLTSPAIIKIDVEGAEPQVLLGMEQFLKTHSPTLVMEFLTGSGQNEAHREALAFALVLGYQVFRIKNDGELELCALAGLETGKSGSDNLVMRK